MPPQGKENGLRKIFAGAARRGFRRSKRISTRVTSLALRGGTPPTISSQPREQTGVMNEPRSSDNTDFPDSPFTHDRPLPESTVYVLELPFHDWVQGNQEVPTLGPSIPRSSSTCSVRLLRHPSVIESFTDTSASTARPRPIFSPPPPSPPRPQSSTLASPAQGTNDSSNESDSKPASKKRKGNDGTTCTNIWNDNPNKGKWKCKVCLSYHDKALVKCPCCTPAESGGQGVAAREAVAPAADVGPGSIGAGGFSFPSSIAPSVTSGGDIASGGFAFGNASAPAADVGPGSIGGGFSFPFTAPSTSGAGGQVGFRNANAPTSTGAVDNNEPPPLRVTGGFSFVAPGATADEGGTNTKEVP